MPCNHHSLGYWSGYPLTVYPGLAQQVFKEKIETGKREGFLLSLLPPHTIQQPFWSTNTSTVAHVFANPTELNITSFQPHIHYTEGKTRAPKQGKTPLVVSVWISWIKGFTTALPCQPGSMIVPHDLDIFMSSVLQSPSSVRGTLSSFQCYKPGVSTLLGTKIHTESQIPCRSSGQHRGRTMVWWRDVCQLYSSHCIPHGKPGRGEPSRIPHTSHNGIKKKKKSWRDFLLKNSLGILHRWL